MSSPARRLIAVLLLLAAPAGAALNVWTPIGPPGAFEITRVYVDPHDPATVYATTRYSGLWRSTDTGLSWTALGFLGVPESPSMLAIDAAGVLYITLQPAYQIVTLWKSEDRGDTWQQVLALPAYSGIGTRSLAADPVTPGTLYWIADGLVYKVAGGGASYSCFPGTGTQCAGELPAASAVAVAADDPDTVYVAANGIQVRRTDDGGATWTELSLIEPFWAVSGGSVNRLAATADPRVVYAWNEEHLPNPVPCLARSDDGGATWKSVLDGRRCGAPAIDPDDPLTVRIAVEGAAGKPPRLWTSRNGGDTWSQGAALPDIGALTLAPTGLLFLAAASGLFRSPDGGSSWLPSSQGLHASMLALLVASPREPGVLYAGVGTSPYTAGPGDSWFLQKSTDAGASWTRLPLRAPTALTVDPHDPRHLYAAFDRERATGGAPRSRIYESLDGGHSWKAISKTLVSLTPYSPYVIVQHLVVDRQDPRILYAGTSGSAFLKSTDRGRTWRGYNFGLPFTKRCESRFCPANQVSEIVQDPGNPRVLYVVFEGNVYRSSNRGGSWTAAGAGPPRDSVRALAIDPARPGVLYATAGSGSPYSPPGTLWRSAGGGRTWSPTELPRVDDGSGELLPVLVYDLAFTSAGLFGAVSGLGVIRSTDGGASWTVVSEGLPGPGVAVLEPDLATPGRLYAGTWAQGIFEARFEP